MSKGIIKKRLKYKKNNLIDFDSLLNSPEDYGFGSWLGKNIGNIAQTVGGAALTFVTGGAAAPIGMSMMASGVGGFANTAGQERQQNALNDSQNELNDANSRQIRGQNRLDQYNANNNLGMIPTFAMGGKLSVNKAKEMLKDGTAHGKKLTAKQKRYFGYIAGGGKSMQDGGLLDGEKVYLPIENKKYDDNLQMSRTWMNDIGKSKSIEEMYNTNVATYEGKPMNLKSFMDLPKGVRDYWRPDYAIEFHKNKLGLPNTYDEINKNVSPQPTYTPAMNYKKYGKSIFYVGSEVNKGMGGDIGSVPSFNDVNPVTEYKGGGTHKQNPNGGIQVGQKARVEEGEIRVDFDEGSYIFSNRIPYNK